MRWILLLAVVGHANAASFAQRPPAGQSPEPTVAGFEDGFFATSGVARFQLIQGRICLDAPRHRKGSQQRETDLVYESVTVTSERGIPSLHYVYQSADHHIKLSVQKASTVRVESWLPKLSQRSVLMQPCRGPVTWSVSQGDQTEEYSAATLLHLRHADRLNFDKHHARLIQSLLRGRSLQKLSRETQSALVGSLRDSTRLPTTTEILDQVADLRSKSRRRRVMAERQLLSWGTPVVATLQTLASEDLDAEQAGRVRSILKRLRPRVDDTAASLAKLLVNDRDYWVQIADSLPADHQSLANQHFLRFEGSELNPAFPSTTRVARRRE
ncbi:MAG: hypothetical protein AB8B91_14350 [Rubripirellula sp.]